MTQPVRRRAGCAALVVTALALTSCSGSDSKAGAAPQPSSSTSASASASPSAPASTDVAPATGKPIDTTWFTARVPRGYDVVVSGKNFSISANGPDADIHFSMIDLNGRELSLAALGRDARKYNSSVRQARLGPTTTLGGEPAYQLTTSKPFLIISVIGLERDGTAIHLEVDSYGTEAEHRKILGSILATWQWK